MYGKIFDSIFDSTLVSDGGWLPTYIFMSMVALADKDGIVALHDKALFRRLGFRDYDSKITYEDFDKAIRFLEEKDPLSNSDAYEGRRLIPVRQIPTVEGNRGWWIVNYQIYRDKGSSTDRVRRHRASKQNKDLENHVTVSALQSVSETHTDTDTDTDTDKKQKKGSRFTPPSVSDVDQYLQSVGKSGFIDSSAFVDFYESKNWYVGKNKMKDWQAAVRTWIRRRKEEAQHNKPDTTWGDIVDG